MKFLGIISLVLITLTGLPSLAQTNESCANQVSQPAFELLAETARECSGPADCASNEVCWTPGICIPATCQTDSDCAMNANCYMGYCQYGE